MLKIINKDRGMRDEAIATFKTKGCIMKNKLLTVAELTVRNMIVDTKLLQEILLNIYKEYLKIF